MDNPITLADERRIINAAEIREHYLIWLARELLRTEDATIRREASEAILQLIERKP